MPSHAASAVIISWRRLLQDETGATAIEYAIIASGVALAIAATLVSLGSSVKSLYLGVETATN